MKKRFVTAILSMILLLAFCGVALADGEVDTIRIRLDFDSLYNYIDGIPEQDVHFAMQKLIKAEAGEKDYYVDAMNSGLTYRYQDGTMYGVTGTDDTINQEKEYYLCICLMMEDGRKLAPADSRKVFLNGQEVECFWPSYSEFDWGCYGYVKLPAPSKMADHEHDFAYLKKDESVHWKECACGAKDAKMEHSYRWVIDVEPTETEAGSRHEECIACGLTGAAETLPAYGPRPEKENITPSISGEKPENKPTTSGKVDRVVAKEVEPEKGIPTGLLIGIVAVAGVGVGAILAILLRKK